MSIQKFRRSSGRASKHPISEEEVSPEFLSRYVWELPDKIEKAKHNQFFTIQTKYHSLINTIKPFKDLVKKYKKQLEVFIAELEEDYKINKLTSESEYYKEHVDYLEKLNTGLDREIQNKREVEAQVRDLVRLKRNELGQLKVDSIKMKMAIERKRDRMRPSQPEQRNVGEYQPPDCALSDEDRELIQAKEEERAAEMELLQKIYNKVMLNELIWSGFNKLRQTLHQDQKKIHNQGLAGSMLFKITSARGKQNNPIPKQHIVRRMDSDLKFLIYDSLKKKYDAKVCQSKCKDNYNVSYIKFQKFTPLQMIGLMELKKNSLKELENSLADRRRSLAMKYYQQC